MTSLHPTIYKLRYRHDDLIGRLHKEREFGGLGPTEISAQLADEIAEFTVELHALGTVLYNDTERSAALCLMSYWINALYRAEWYQGRGEEPPAPELADFSPNALAPLREEDYPWAHPDVHGESPETSALWARLTRQAVKVLKSRRLLGITGAAGSGRSQLIEHGILPALRDKKRDGGLREYIVSPSDAIVGPAASGASSEYDDRRFLTALLPIAKAAGGGHPVHLDEDALEKDPKALAKILDDSGERHLIVMQDLDQLFTLTADPFNPEPTMQQRAFVSALCAVATSAAGHLVIMDVQTEILGRLRKFEDFRYLIDCPSEDNAQDGWLLVAFEGMELRNFITQPAACVGLHFEAGLIDRLILEHQNEPAALTLLLFTLRRLWRDMLLYHCNPGERRNMITWSNYQRVGSGRVIFEIAADEATKAVLDQEATDEDKKCALRAIELICLELVRILPGGAWWLAKVPRAKIKSKLEAVGHPPKRIERILSEFIRVGLFIQESNSGGGEMMLRIFHHAVVGRWTRLVQWVEAKRAEMRTYWLLRADAADWNRLREPSPVVKKAGRWVRIKDALSRLDSRMSRLWRGSKLRDARSLPDLNPHERDFLRMSWRMWWLRIAVLLVGIGSIPVALIVAFVLWEHQGRSLNTALLMDRGVNLLAEGDPASASLWLAQTRLLDQRAPLKRLFNISSPAREAAHEVSIGMAFRRLPALDGLTTVADGLISTDISPSGRYALLGCRTQGNVQGRAILWTLGDRTEQKEELKLRTESGLEDFSIDRVAFARSTDDPALGSSHDTLMALGGSVGDGSKGVVFVREVSKAGKPPARFDFDDRVRDLAFFPARSGEPWRLAVAFGDQTKQPSHGGVEILAFDPAGDSLERSRLPLPGPATRLALSGTDQLAIAYSEPDKKTWQVSVFSNAKKNKNGWNGHVVSKDLLPITDLALSKDGSMLAIATANKDNSAGTAHLFAKVADQSWVETSADVPLQLGGGMQCVRFSPNGHSLFAATSNGVIGIWSLGVTGKPTLLRKLNEGGWTFSAEWSPDGLWIATGNRDRYARLWDVASGQLALPPLYHGGTVANVRFTPDGLHMLTNTLYSARLWSTAPREDSVLPVQAAEGRSSHALLSSDGQRVAVASLLSGQLRDGVRESELALWDINPGESQVPRGRLQRLHILDTVALNADGSMVAALTEPQTQKEQNGERKVRRLLVWNTIDNKQVDTDVEVGADFLSFIPGSPQRLLVAGALTSTKGSAAGSKASVGFMQLFDLSQPRLAARLVPLEFRVKASAASKDGARLAIGGDAGQSPIGGFIGVFNVLNAGNPNSKPVRPGTAAVAPLSRHTEAVTALAFSPDARWLLSGSIDDHVKLFTVEKPEGAPPGEGGLQGVGITAVGDAQSTKHTADVTSVGFSHNGCYAVSTGLDSLAILWGVSKEGLKRRASLDHRGVVSTHAFSADDRWLATGGDDGVRLWSLKTNCGFWHTVWQAAIHKASSLSFGLWRPKTESQLRPAELVAALPHRFPVVGVAFRSSSNSAPSDLRTLAQERAAGDQPGPRSVEAHCWSLAPIKEEPAEIQKQANLLAGRLLDLDRLHAADLSGEKLKVLWDESKDKRDLSRADGKAHLSRASSAAAAGDWRAAAMHLQELPDLANPGTAVNRPDVLRFAVDIFAANHQPREVFRTIEKLTPEKINDPEISLDLIEKRGEACIQIARATANATEPWLERAEKDFRALAEKQPEESTWRTRMAEISVMRGKLPEAITLLEVSKGLASAPPTPGASLVMRFTTASQDQRIGAIHLLLADQALRNGNEAEAWRQRQQWEQLVRKALDDYKTSKAFEKARAAWPAVLGETQDKEVVEQALAFAEEGYRDRPDNYGRLNTYATALLRAGKFDDALLRLNDSIELYERDPLNPRKAQPGRPVDWIVRSLILYGKSTQESDLGKREKLLTEVRDSLKAAEKSLEEKEPESQITWRATWNNVDLRVLVTEAERKLNRD
jgi:WD40 repeat protein/tetratricopeptide (TPR) repeat protein